MRKLNTISFIAILASFVGLVLLSVTGLKAHIAISVIALLIMLVCTVKGKKYWKKPALEVFYRIAYLITLVTGAVMVANHVAGGVSIAHKVFAAVFILIYVINFFVSKKD